VFKAERKTLGWPRRRQTKPRIGGREEWWGLPSVPQTSGHEPNTAGAHQVIAAPSQTKKKRKKVEKPKSEIAAEEFTSA